MSWDCWLNIGEKRSSFVETYLIHLFSEVFYQRLSFIVPSAHNWRPYIEHVVKELEGNDDPKAVDIREQEIRDKIRPTASCDARADNPLGDIQEKFDAIHTNLCLEAVADDVDAFYCYFNNMCQYLKPNGYIVLMTACECDSYRCWEGENNLHVVSLKPENIKEACKRAGIYCPLALGHTIKVLPTLI